MARIVLGLGILLLCACGEGTRPPVLPPYDGPLTTGQVNPTGYQPGSIDINDLIGGGGVCADTSIFTDDFNAGASPLWGNEIGNWTVTGGIYSALTLSNFPNGHTSLPFSLIDFSIEFDITDVQDGGVWLRSAPASTSIGRTGVLLVTGGNSGTWAGLYWHIVTSGSYGANLNGVGGLFTPGVTDTHIRVEVSGDTYAAFLDGSPTPVTTLTTTAFASGQVALFDLSMQTFDNVVVAVPCGGP